MPRPRLVERLHEGLHRKLTLISAPAGFGKTTLVTEWLKTLNAETSTVKTWLSLDEGDNNPDRFLVYFIAALTQVDGYDAGFGETAMDMLQSPQRPPTESILSALINEIAATAVKVIFVLDDYHLIQSQPIHDLLDFWIENLPPQMHLVLATREDPPLPLSRLRARDQMTELRAADLRFTSAETAIFLSQVMGLNLSARDIADLEDHTEGWAAGLQLAGISLQGRADTTRLIQSFSGSNRLILDYLVEEVLNQQPKDGQDFLLQTAILERLSGPLCDAVTLGNGGQAVLESLERANLFLVPLDEERLWYRYHHLFADLLRVRLRQSRSSEIPELHLRACEWFERNDLVAEAVDHALAARALEKAADLVEKHTLEMFPRGELNKMLVWVKAMPEALARSRPWLCIYQAWALSIAGKWDEAEPLLADVERFLDPEGADKRAELNIAERKEMLGNIAAMRAYAAVITGDYARAVEFARQAEALLTEKSIWACSIFRYAVGLVNFLQGDLEVAGDAFREVARLGSRMDNTWTITSGLTELATVYREQGRLHRSVSLYQETLQTAAEHNAQNYGYIGRAEAGLAHVLYEQNDLEAAYPHAAAGVEKLQLWQNPNQCVFAYEMLARVKFAQGDIEEAAEWLQKAVRLVQEQSIIQSLVAKVEKTRIWMWQTQGNIAAIQRWVQELCLDGPGDDKDSRALALARAMMAQNDIPQALEILSPLAARAEAGGRINALIEILVLRALALAVQNNTKLALESLARALALAGAEGYTRVFLDEGPPMARLLYEALSQDISPVYIRRLLAAFPEPEPEQASTDKAQPDPSGLIEPLSEREIEVLQLIAEGLTNREIAARLYLSLHTVKAHTRNIYGKLGVSNRTQASAKAKTLGLIAQ